MTIPELGDMKECEDGCFDSTPIAVPVLGGKLCTITLEKFSDDPKQEEFLVAVRNFLAIPPDVLKEAEVALYKYYKNCAEYVEDDEILKIDSPSEVWKYITLGNQVWVKRRAYGDKGIYVILDSDCEWEVEHGLQIVLKNGLKVNKIGPFDGHLTNSDSYDREDYEDAIYPGVS
jgi:hypothetical protein